MNLSRLTTAVAGGHVMATPARAQEAAMAAAVSGSDTAKLLRAALPRDLSPWNMFLSADGIVKAVIIGLALASVITWTVGLAKWIELRRLRRNLRNGLVVLDASRTLADACCSAPWQ
jgi:biopolymer transport protein ExbB